MTDTAVLLVCIGANAAYIAAAKLTIKSLRSAGQFAGDILLFTDQECIFDDQDANIINVDESAFLKQFPALDQERRHWSYLFRVFMGFYFKASDYSRVLYLDIDVLCHRPIAPVIASISEDHLHFSYAAAVMWLDKSASTLSQQGPFFRDFADITLLDRSPLAKASPTGICSGIFGTSGQNFDRFMTPWRELILASFSAGIPICDQMAFNECLLKGDIPGIAMPNEWIAYPLWKLLGRKDLRALAATKEQAILYHFNPTSAETKLGYMKAFMGFGPVT